MNDDNAAHASGGDQNKTKLTLDVTLAASNWLKDIGAKPIEAEVAINRRWIADLAAMWSPTRTEAQKQKLIPAKLPWRSTGSRARSLEREAAYRAIPHDMCIVHEVKVTRADFRRDHKWNKASPADMRMLSIVPGIVKEEEWPLGWWVIVHDGTTGAVSKVVKRAAITPVTVEQRFRVLMQLAVRRHNRTEYAFMKDLMRHQNDSDNDRINRTRYASMARLMSAIYTGKHESVENCVTRYIEIGRAHV